MKELHEMGYDELNDHVKDAIKEMRRKAYAEGYGQGKFDAKMDDDIQDAKLREISEAISTPEIVDKLVQKKRDEVVEEAKADVGYLSNNGFSFPDSGCKRLVKYIINKEKRTVVALLSGYLSGIVYERGVAKCDPSDCFNVHIGKAIALRRALGLDIPTYYLNAPNPTEVRVGDIVDTYLGSGQHHSIITVSGFWCGDSNQLTEYGKSGYIPFQPHFGDRIIDDSRE